MNNQKETKKNSSRILQVLLFVLIIVLAALIALIIVLNGRNREDQNISSEQLLTEEQPALQETSIPTGYTEPQVPSGDDLGGEHLNDYLISTPIAKLYIPEVWKEMVRTEQMSEEDCFIVTVFSTGDAPEVKLYTIYIGAKTAQGILLGTAAAEDGTFLDVYFAVDEIEINDDWDSGEIDTLFAIQESVNDIIRQITELPGFQIAQ